MCSWNRRGTGSPRTARSAGDRDSTAHRCTLVHQREQVKNGAHVCTLSPHRDEVEDVVQEVFIEVFRSIARFRGDAKISTWLYRVCVNVALQRLRKRRRLNEVSPEGGPETTDEHTPQRALEAQERLRAVYRI